MDGIQHHHGSKLLAALMHKWPAFSRFGGRKLPRFHRALRGWRLLTPGQSKKAFPLILWEAVAAVLAMQGNLMAAVFVMLAISTYLRPSELLDVTRQSVIPPCRDVLDHWSIVVARFEQGHPTKTGIVDGCVVLDWPWATWMQAVVPYLRKGKLSDKVFPFRYPELVKLIKKATTFLEIPHLTLYQARHSGASIDRAKKARTLDEVQRRGFWASKTSVNRYEKSSRMAADYLGLPAKTRELVERYASRVEDYVLGSKVSRQSTLG